MSIWSQASEIAQQTPADRNRYVDFLRAVSILFVIIGHWLITSAYYHQETGQLDTVLALDVIPWTAWLSWVFQVMPIFFIVGGYSNAVSLESAKKKNLTYSQWLTGRLHRLLTPLLLLVVFWALLSLSLGLFGIPPETIALMSKVALVPTWFLAIYTMIVLLAPVTYAFWRRWGIASLLVYILMAALVDFAFFELELPALGWTNYFWVWLAVHHLGFAWHDGRLGRRLTLSVLAIGSFALLYLLIYFGPYPIAMAGSPGEAVSNTLPPKVTLVALGLFQFGLLLAIEKPMQRFLSKAAPWTLTIIINTMIMTVYLWHMTVLIFLIGMLYLLGGTGLEYEVGTGAWWSSRPIWLVVLFALLIPVALLLSPLERISAPKGAAVPARWRLILGAFMSGAGITMATLLGFNGNLLSLSSTGAVALMLGGGLICGLTVSMYR
ncbi:MAG: acyltransferase, partial [Halioglobus sp.]